MTNDPQKDAKRHRIQMEMVMKDGDYKKNERKKMEVEIEIRQLKQKRVQLDSEIMAKERDLNGLHGNQLVLLGEIKKLKNELNIL